MNETNQLISTFNNLMVANNYQIASPVNSDVMADLMHKAPPAE